MSLDEAKVTQKKIVLVKGQVSNDARKAGTLLRSYLGRAHLPMYVGTLRQTALEPVIDGQTECHNNTLALARDLWNVDHNGWHVLLGELDPGRGHHSWIEYGDAAVDTTYGRMVVSLKAYHISWAGVRSGRGFTGPNGFDEYLYACRYVGLFGSKP
jgi:hypothetical protein